MKRVLTSETFKVISLVETTTGAHVVDYFPEKNMFVIANGQMGLAIGKKGATIRKLEHLLKKKLTFVEFNEDPVIFLKNLFSNISFSASVTDDVLEIKAENGIARGKLFGREKSVLSFLKVVFKRHFSLNDVVVL